MVFGGLAIIEIGYTSISDANYKVSVVFDSRNGLLIKHLPRFVYREIYTLLLMSFI